MSVKCKLHFKKVTPPVQLSALTQIVSRRKLPSVLGGNDSCSFSVWACEPVEVFEFTAEQAAPLDKLDAVLKKYSLDCTPPKLPAGIFCGGWIGYFGYELGRFIENIPAAAIDDLDMPIIRLAFYDAAIVYDHSEKVWFIIALEINADDINAKFDRLESLLSVAQAVSMPDIPEGDIEAVRPDDINRNMTKERYLSSIEKTRRYIYDGEVYQINFSHRFECEYSANPVDLYHWQNKFNPSPYAAYIDFDRFAIVSASPELFITINDGVISTKPIKGTRPRLVEGKDAERINRINFRQLIESEKDQAELNMIIDLERNDLTRICEYGTIKVTQPRTIERFATVYHAVATIEGRLRKGVTFSDCLRAMFPGGSITGAPKIRSMEIIDELEPACRGVYTGSIGFIGIDGSSCLNIAIRTVIIKDGTAFAQSGGGIVADSDPQAEWDETITKARALIAGIYSVRRSAYSVQYGERNKEDERENKKL